ncbi:MAG: hypothetical protein JWR50_4386 [Mucilaginibacter sp.]|nr:hypothetical protein [Mucilaginibacter sp.]
MKYSLFVFSAPVAGKEEEYNKWYNEKHLADLLKIPAIPSARRYRVADAQADGPLPPLSPYLAIYEIETNDLASVFNEISTRADTGEITMTDAIDLSKVQLVAYELLYSTNQIGRS